MSKPYPQASPPPSNSLTTKNNDDMSKTIEEAAEKAIIDNDFFMADPKHPDFVDRGLEQMRACKWVINHIFSLPIASRLTAEEKERVRKMYKRMELDAQHSDSYDCIPSSDMEDAIEALESIFGADFFKEEGE